jgi:hypothetical protein
MIPLPQRAKHIDAVLEGVTAMVCFGDGLRNPYALGARNSVILDFMNGMK